MSSLKRSLQNSLLAHVGVLLLIVIIPSLTFRFRERPLAVTWIELPKGASLEIGTGIKKSEQLPRSTIEEQKQPPSEQKTLKPDAKGKTAEPKQVMPEPKKLSPTDEKIKKALAKIDKELKTRGAQPEAAQVEKSEEGYQYGTGTDPLRAMPTDPEYLKYQSMVRAKIMGEWIIPPSFLEEGAPLLNARLEVRIDYDGEIASAAWIARSGNTGFDASCMRAVQRSSPLPKPPDRLALEVYNEGFLIEFDPRLKP